ncbi:MAG: GAF domain-containing protein [Anaerolineales bacterium]|nr:GAF domain-containing protein [Chloroflexota bacterium]MBL6979729.1 GAF domain-containing protein [Anaerolineales bacterium]
MSVDNNPTQTNHSQERFRGRIQRRFLLVMIPLAMLPLLIIGSIIYVRARTLLVDQIHEQVDSYLRVVTADVDNWLNTAQIRVEATLRQASMNEALAEILALENKESFAYATARQTILNNLTALNSERVSVNFSEFLIISSSGEVLISTQPIWEGFYLTDSPFSKIYYEKPGTFIDYALAPLSNDQIMIFVHVPFQGSENTRGYIVGLLSNNQLLDFLTSSVNFLPDANNYVILEDEIFLGLDFRLKELAVLSPTQSQIDVLVPLKDQILHGGSEEHTNLTLRSFDNSQSLAAYTWLPSLGAALVIDVPEVIAYKNLQSLTPIAIISTIVALGLLSLTLWIAFRQLIRPIQTLTETTRQFSKGNWELRVPESRDDEIGALSHTFNLMAEELSELYQSLSSQVAEQTLELHNRSSQLEATAQVAREASAIRDLDTLLRDTTELISSNFDFYHAGIFLIDEDNRFAVLQAANSEGGQRMLKRGHKLRVGQTGVVGRVAETGLPRIALDVGEDLFFFDNPDLPETRSEMALPLRSQDKIIGVLDVQSKTSGAFSNKDVEVLQIMADQVAMAIENASLLDQSQKTVQELQTLYGVHIEEAWQQRLGGITKSYHFDRVRVKQASDEQISSIIALENDQVDIYIDDQGYQHLLIPITLRGHSLGNISLRRNPDETEWTEEDQELAEEVSTQIAVALENARLLEESQRRAAQEELLSQASARFSQSLDINTVLQMAVRELGQLAGVAEVSVQLTPKEQITKN